MNARLERTAPARQLHPIALLAHHVANNRFMPLPPAERRMSGDGDFRAVGAEFLEHLVRIGGLQPGDTMLEMGCGIGRLALPLTQYLASRARYVGTDVSVDGIHWCHEHITSVYPNFGFHHVDARHPLYNPDGQLDACTARSPLQANSADFVAMVSLVTHLAADGTGAQLAEARRVLRAGGRLFLTAFVVDSARTERLRRGEVVRLPFDVSNRDGVYIADPEHPTAAVAYARSRLLAMLDRAGFDLAREPVAGHWCGGVDARNFQDILVLERRA